MFTSTADLVKIKRLSDSINPLRGDVIDRRPTYSYTGMYTSMPQSVWHGEVAVILSVTAVVSVRLQCTQQTQVVDPTLIRCWISVVDCESTLGLCLLGQDKRVGDGVLSKPIMARDEAI